MSQENLSQVLKSIAHSNPTAEAMFYAFSLKERTRGPLDVTRFQKFLRDQIGEKFSAGDFLETLSKMQGAGVGRLVFSSRGRLQAFNWVYSAQSVGAAGLEGGKEPQKRSSRKRRIISNVQARRLARDIQAASDKAYAELPEAKKRPESTATVEFKGLKVTMPYSQLTQLIKDLG